MAKPLEPTKFLFILASVLNSNTVIPLFHKRNRFYILVAVVSILGAHDQNLDIFAT